MGSYTIIEGNTIKFEKNKLGSKFNLLPIFLELFMRLGWEIIAIDPSNVVAMANAKWNKKSEIYIASSKGEDITLSGFNAQSEKITVDTNNKNFNAIIKDYEFLSENMTDEEYQNFAQEFKLLLSISKENDKSLAKFAPGKSPEQISQSIIGKLIDKVLG